MKKVISGKLYNTETAKMLGKAYSEADRSSWSFWMEELYKTKSGAYFMYGEGGPQTKYASSSGNNNWGYGEKLYPMTPESARKWAEENLTADEYSAVFGEPEEAGDTKEPLNITITVELKRRLEKMKEETGKSISQIIEDRFAE